MSKFSSGLPFFLSPAHGSFAVSQRDSIPYFWAHTHSLSTAHVILKKPQCCLQTSTADPVWQLFNIMLCSGDFLILVETLTMKLSKSAINKKEKQTSIC